MNKSVLVMVLMAGALSGTYCGALAAAATPSRPPPAPAARPAPAVAPAPARAPSPSFGTAVKPQVGSGSSAKGGTSGLRPTYNAASGASPAAGKSGGSAKVATVGKTGSARPPVRPEFNKAAGSGSGRVDGRQTPAPRPRPSATDAFGKTAMKAEHAQGKQGAARRGQAIHENTVNRRPANKPAP